MCTVDSSSVKPRKSHKTVWCTCLFFISMTFISIYRLRFGDFFSISLREKCPNTELFLVRIFLYSDQKWLNIWTLSTQWCLQRLTDLKKLSGSKQILSLFRAQFWLCLKYSFYPISYCWSISIPLENMRKFLVFWCFSFFLSFSFW